MDTKKDAGAAQPPAGAAEYAYHCCLNWPLALCGGRAPRRWDAVSGFNPARLDACVECVAAYKRTPEAAAQLEKARALIAAADVEVEAPADVNALKLQREEIVRLKSALAAKTDAHDKDGRELIRLRKLAATPRVSLDETANLVSERESARAEVEKLKAVVTSLRNEALMTSLRNEALMTSLRNEALSQNRYYAGIQEWVAKGKAENDRLMVLNTHLQAEITRLRKHEENQFVLPSSTRMSLTEVCQSLDAAAKKLRDAMDP